MKTKSAERKEKDQTLEKARKKITEVELRGRKLEGEVKRLKEEHRRQSSSQENGGRAVVKRMRAN